MKILSELTFQICQINATVGDIKKNETKIAELIEKAERNKEVDVLIFPELVLSGYPPRDLLYYQSFLDDISEGISHLAKLTKHTTVIFGSPYQDTGKGVLRNAAVVLASGKVQDVVFKTLLPDYDVFDESRYFLPDQPRVILIKGIKVGLQICEDLWDHMWMHAYRVTEIQSQLGAEIIINISASPFTLSKPQNRVDIVKDRVSKIRLPFIYVNLVGGQDELVFDGRSFVSNYLGKITYAAKSYEEDFPIIDKKYLFSKNKREISNFIKDDLEEISRAIILNLRDYLLKSKLPNKLLVALSGGIDSALTAALATMAVGKENVTVVFLPTQFSASQSRDDSKLLARNLGIDYIEMEIEEIRALFDSKLHELKIIDDIWSIADENIQSRIRANIMMYLSNKKGKILISTGNKSEISVGYCTIYGDTAGGKNLIGDLYKQQVYALARYINKDKEIIPTTIIERPPTAELKADQKDTDSLPPYEILDGILTRFVDQHKSTREIINEGFEEETVKYVIDLIIKSEFKRAQMVQTVKVSDIAFGFGWKMPVSNTYKP